MGNIENAIDLGDQRDATNADNISSHEIGGQDAFPEPVKFDPRFATLCLHEEAP